MDAAVMRAKLTALSALALLAVSLSGCAGYQTGAGLNRFDTEGIDSKEDETWFGNFYGSDHCVWGEDCADTSKGGANHSSGAMSPVDAATHDSGSTHSDSGSMN